MVCNFSSNTPSRWKLSVIQWIISKSTWWIGTKFCTDVHDPQRMNPADFSSSIHLFLIQIRQGVPLVMNPLSRFPYYKVLPERPPPWSRRQSVAHSAHDCSQSNTVWKQLNVSVNSTWVCYLFDLCQFKNHIIIYYKHEQSLWICV